MQQSYCNLALSHRVVVSSAELANESGTYWWANVMDLKYIRIMTVWVMCSWYGQTLVSRWTQIRVLGSLFFKFIYLFLYFRFFFLFFFGVVVGVVGGGGLGGGRSGFSLLPMNFQKLGQAALGPLKGKWTYLDLWVIVIKNNYLKFVCYNGTNQ